MGILAQILTGFALLLSYITWTAFYRLCLHPLSRFPGPKLAVTSRWYEFYFDIVKRPGGTYMYEIERMHKIYGPIVRVTPEEIHIKDPEWIQTLFSSASEGLRDKYQPAAHMTGTPLGVFGTVDHHIHRRRRAAIAPLFSRASALSSQNLIFKIVNRLSRKIKRDISSGKDIEMRSTYLAAVTDAVSEYALHMPRDTLRSDQVMTDWKRTINALASLTPLIRQFTWIIDVALQTPVCVLQAVIPDLARVIVLRREMYKQASAIIDQRVTDEKETGKLGSQAPRLPSNVFQSIIENKSLSRQDKSKSRLAQEAFVVLVAGSETTAQILSIATYHILANKSKVLPELQKELAAIMTDPEDQPDIKDLENLPWLTAIIKESLRIAALVTSRLPLVSPKEVLTYREYEIQPGTPVSMTLRHILLDPEIFPEPLNFKPERWLEQSPLLERMNQAFIPFGRGSRMCLGMNGFGCTPTDICWTGLVPAGIRPPRLRCSFAYTEMYIILACLFRRFDFELFDTTRERDVDVVRDCFIGAPTARSKGIRVKATATE